MIWKESKKECSTARTRSATPRDGLSLRAVARRVCVLAALVLAGLSLQGCRAPGQPPPPAWPLGLGSNVPYQTNSPVVSPGKLPFLGTIPPAWFHPLDDWSAVYDMSDDGKAFCGEMPSGIASGAHGQGVRWDWDGAYPESFVPALVPFPTADTINNPALGISPDGKSLAGSATVPPFPNGSDAYLFTGGTIALPPFPTLPAEAMATAVSDGKHVVGQINSYDSPAIDRTALTVGVTWFPQANGTYTPIYPVQNIGNPNPNEDPVPSPNGCMKLNDVSADGHYIVGGMESPAALLAYSDVGTASEAVLYKSLGLVNGAYRFTRTMLGFPPGIARNYSRAIRIASDTSSPNGLIIVGTSGGYRQDNVPNAGDKHPLDQRPTVWRVSGNKVNAQRLQLIKKSSSLPHPQFGGAGNVSKGGDFIVGSCGASASPAADDYIFDAVIWRRGVRPESIKDLLVAAGANNLKGITLDGASGVSADGRIVCGVGHRIQGKDWIYFGWIAMVPPK